MALQGIALSWQGIAHLHDEHPKNAALAMGRHLFTMPTKIVIWLSVSWISQLLICGALVI